MLRATQFHDLIKMIFSIQRFSPLLWTLRDVRVPGRIVAGYRAGANLAPDNPVIDFAEYLAEIK